jgi:hypothetical protein
MASIFPIPDHVGQEFTIGTTTYQWTGSAWIKVASATSIKSLTVNNLTVTSVLVTATTIAISTTTGALVVNGGVGIGGALYVNTLSFVNGAEILTSATLAQYVLQPVFYAGTGTAITTSTEGFVQNVKIWSTSTLQTVTDQGSSTTNKVRILNTSSATSVGTGALIVDGGISARGDLWLGGTIYSAGVPVITTSTLVDSFTAGTDIKIVSTITGLSTQTTLIISNTSTLQTVTSRGSSTNRVIYFTNTTNSTSSSTGAIVVTGGVGIGGRVNAESVQIADTIMDSGKVLVNTTDTVIIDTYNVTDFRSSKYLIQIDEGTGPGANFETIEMLLLVDNSGNVYATEYAVLTSNGDLGEFAADVIGNTVNLYFTAYQTTDKVLRIFRTAMRVL